MYSSEQDQTTAIGGAVMTKYNELDDGFVGKDGILHQGPPEPNGAKYILAPFTATWMGSEMTLNDALGPFWRLSHWDDREHYVRVNVHELKHLYRYWAETFQDLDAIDGRARRSTDVVDRALVYVVARMKYLERFLGTLDAELIRFDVERASEEAAAADENPVDGDVPY
jgi:hypothetical protein